MPGPLVKVRVLMFGSDEALLQIRAKVLATIGVDTHLLYTMEEARQELTAHKSDAALLVICHSAEQELAQQVRSLAVTTGLPIYYVETLLRPQQLVEDITGMLKQGGRRSRAANGRPSA